MLPWLAVLPQRGSGVLEYGTLETVREQRCIVGDTVEKAEFPALSHSSLLPPISHTHAGGWAVGVESPLLP